MSHQLLEFDYSLIASSALFLACKCGDYNIESEKMLLYQEYLDIYSQREFEKCLVSMKHAWNFIKTAPSYLNFEAVYNKFQTQYNFIGRTLVPPAYNHNELKNWFYSKY